MNNITTLQEDSEHARYWHLVDSVGYDGNCLQCLMDSDSGDVHTCLPNDTANDIVMPVVEHTTMEKIRREEKMPTCHGMGESLHVCVTMSGGCVPVKFCKINVPTLVTTGVSISFIVPGLVVSLNEEWYLMMDSCMRDGISLEYNATHIAIHRVTYILEGRNASGK